MNVRLLAVPAIALLVLLAACGGGGSSSSATPTEGITPSPTPEPVACTASSLYAALIASEDVGGGTLLTIGLTNTLPVCYVDGPPAINWYDAAGDKLDVPEPASVQCQPQAGDYSTCVFDGRVTLPEGAPTPAAGVSGQAIAIVAVSDGTTCDTPPAAAHFIGLQFPGISVDAQVELTTDVSVPACDGQVTFQGYGPLPVPQE